MSSNASVNITSLEDTKEVAKLTALGRDSENETSSGSDAFDSKCRSGNFAALGKTNNNTEEEPGFRNERDDILQCVRQNFVDTSTPVALPHNNHVENIEEDADEGGMDIKSPSNLDNNLNQKEDFITDRQALKPENSPEGATYAVEKIEIDQEELCPLAENKEINEAELTDSKVSILTFDRSERNEEKIEIDQDDEELDSTSGGETSQDKILTDCIDRTEEDIEIDQEDDNTSGAADATDPSLDGKLIYAVGIESKEVNSSDSVYGEEIDQKDDNTSGAADATYPSLDGKLIYAVGIESKEVNSSDSVYGEEIDQKDDNTSGAADATYPSLDGKLIYAVGIESKEVNSSDSVYGEENANESSKEEKSDGAVTEQREKVNDKCEEENTSNTVVLLQDEEKVIQKTVEGDITDGVVPAPAEGNVTKGNKSDSVTAEEEFIVDPVGKSPDASLERTQEHSLSDIDNFENLNKTTSDKDLGIGHIGSESEVNLHTQKNKKDSFDKPSDMGQCYPSPPERSSSGKPRKNISEESKKERGRNAFRQLPESHHWSDHDTKVYREGYPNKKDNPKLNHNLKFYQGTLSSCPDGDFIDNIHKKWWGDYDLLERHHGYIQWLFPIRESGMNWQAQELQMHEAKAIQKDEKASERFLKSYEMMLDFYGMKLVDRNNGQVQRSEKWKERFHHLNHSMHNYLRITRILKCLGEMGLEHFKKPFIRFILNEAIYKGTLDRTLDSCLNYWVGTLRKDEDRQEMEEYTKQLFNRKDNHS